MVCGLPDGTTITSNWGGRRMPASGPLHGDVGFLEDQLDVELVRRIVEAGEGIQQLPEHRGLAKQRHQDRIGRQLRIGQRSADAVATCSGGSRQRRRSAITERKKAPRPGWRQPGRCCNGSSTAANPPAASKTAAIRPARPSDGGWPKIPASAAPGPIVASLQQLSGHARRWRAAIEIGGLGIGDDLQPVVAGSARAPPRRRRHNSLSPGKRHQRNELAAQRQHASSSAGSRRRASDKCFEIQVGARHRHYVAAMRTANRSLPGTRKVRGYPSGTQCNAHPTYTTSTNEAP